MYLAATRYFLIGVLLVLNVAILVLSASLFSVSDSNNIYRPIFVYLIFLGAFSCVFLIPIALIDLFRRGALPSRVLYELIWLILFWVMHLAGASALTAAPECTADDSCGDTRHTLLIFSWLAVSVLLFHLAALFVIALLHMNDLPDVWSMGVRDVPWFHTPSHQQQQDKPNVSAAANAPRQNGGQQPQSEPWHGRRRSHASRSWRERYASQNLTSQPQDHEQGAANEAVDAARAFYPFLGQGGGNGDDPAAFQQQPQYQDETMLEPLPVSFTLERLQPQSQSQPQPQQSQPRTRARDSRDRRSNGSGGSNNPFYNHAMYEGQTQAQQRERQRPERRSKPPQMPQPPAPVLAQPPQRSRSRVQAAYAAAPSASRPRGDRSSRTAEPQLVPLDLGQSQPPVSQPEQQPSFPPSSPPRRQSQRAPPTDSLLFSTPAPSSSQPQPQSQRQHSQSQSRSRTQRSTAGPPPSATRLLPDTSAFYATHVQSVLREGSVDGGTEDDGHSMAPSRIVYASTPKPKPMSAAQAYAAEARRSERR